MIGAESQKDYLTAIASGKGKITAARLIGVSPGDMSRYIEMTPAFKELYEEAMAERLEKVANMMWERAQEGGFKEMELVLTTQAAQEWMRPDKELVFKMQSEVKELSAGDIEELQRRLEMRRNAIDVAEVSDGDSDPGSTT